MVDVGAYDREQIPKSALNSRYLVCVLGKPTREVTQAPRFKVAVDNDAAFPIDRLAK